MKKRKLVFLILAGTGYGQEPKIPRDPPIYFYNQRLDSAGQDVAKAAGDVSGAQLFEAQLANLDAVARMAADRIFTSARRDMLAKIEAARTWTALYERVERARAVLNQAKPSESEWKLQIEKLKQAADRAEQKAHNPGEKLKAAADLLEEAGKSEQAIQFARVLEQQRVAGITATDLRVAVKLQEALGNLGAVLERLSSLPAAPSSRSAAEQMKVDLAKAEIDHLNAMIEIEEKRLNGEHDVKGILTAIDNGLTCAAPRDADVPRVRDCALRFQDDDGRQLPDLPVSGTETIEATLGRLRNDPFHLDAVVYLLENYAALAARADTPARLGDLRSAVEQRRFQIRRDAIMARAYERVLLVGAQRIALYYRGGIRPETLAQIASALATAGLIPTIALK